MMCQSKVDLIKIFATVIKEIFLVLKNKHNVWICSKYVNWGFDLFAKMCENLHVCLLGEFGMIAVCSL